MASSQPESTDPFGLHRLARDMERAADAMDERLTRETAMAVIPSSWKEEHAQLRCLFTAEPCRGGILAPNGSDCVCAPCRTSREIHLVREQLVRRTYNENYDVIAREWLQRPPTLLSWLPIGTLFHAWPSRAPASSPAEEATICGIKHAQPTFFTIIGNEAFFCKACKMLEAEPFAKFLATIGADAERRGAERDRAATLYLLDKLLRDDDLPLPTCEILRQLLIATLDRALPEEKERRGPRKR